MSDPTDLSSNRAGAVSEHVVAIRLLELGYNVVRPQVPCRYDFVADLGDQLVRTQVKRGFADSREKTLRVNLTGSVHKGGTSYESVTYDGEEVDAFAIHDPINDGSTGCGSTRRRRRS